MVQAVATSYMRGSLAIEWDFIVHGWSSLIIASWIYISEELNSRRFSRHSVVSRQEYKTIGKIIATFRVSVPSDTFYLQSDNQTQSALTSSWVRDYIYAPLLLSML